MPIENKNYKDSVFRLLFNNRERLLELYNAINGTSYDNPEELEIKTLKGNTFLKVRNDASFIIEFRLNLYEHQSTPFPNIPLRNLYYVASILIEIVPLKKTYGETKVNIPSPKFFVFYNGSDYMLDQVTYKLSDMFSTLDPNPSLELIVTAYNVNEGHNQKLMEACKTLKSYSIFVSKVRQYKQKGEEEYNSSHSEPLSIVVDKSSIMKEIIFKAVTKAIDECIAEDILADFFKEHRQEVIDLSISEYITDEMAEVFKEDGFYKGMAEGLRKGELKGKTEGHQDIITLFNWLTQNNRKADIDKALTDSVFLDKLFKEYNSENK